MRRIDGLNLDKEDGWKDVILTTGSQQALYAILDTMIDPGNVILTPSPAYLGFLAPAFKIGAEIVTIPTDLEGLIPEYVEKAIPLAEKKFGKKKSKAKGKDKKKDRSKLKLIDDDEIDGGDK